MGLQEAEDALGSGALGVALTAMLAVWRDVRDPRLSALIRAVPLEARPALPTGTGRGPDAAWHALARDGDPCDLPRLTDGLLTGTTAQGIARLQALPDDPRLAHALVALLDRPARTAQTTRPFWREVFARLDVLSDPSVIPGLEDVARDVAARVRTAVGDWMGNQAGKLARTLSARPVPALSDPALPALERRLAGPLGRLRRAVATQDAGHRSEASLRAAVFADPTARGPREVYADWLMDQGDPHGDWVRSQLDGHDAPAPDPVRVLGPLAPIAEWIRTREGFADVLGIWRNKTSVRAAIGLPEWATVREIHVQRWASTTEPLYEQAVRLLTAPSLARLEAIAGIDPAGVDAMLTAGRPLRAVRYTWLGSEHLPGVAAQIVAARLDHVGFVSAGLPIKPVLAALSNVRTVEAPHPQGWLAPLQDTPVEGMVVRRGIFSAELRFRRGADGRLSALSLHPTTAGPCQLDWVAEILSQLPRGAVTAFEVLPLDDFGLRARAPYTPGWSQADIASLHAVIR